MSNPKSKDLVSADRRRFLTTFALGAAAAPILSLGRSVLAGAGAPQAASLCYSNKRVLASSDIQYLGAMRMPAAGAYLDFSYGSMTGRNVNGQVRLFLLGAINKGDPLYEIADTGVYNVNPAQAPRAMLVKTWGDIYGNARRTWSASGTEKVGYPRYMGSLKWIESRQLLYWTYYDSYNTTGDEDWCLGATRLDPAGPVAFGPWRPAGGSGTGKRGPWKCLRITEHPVTGELLCGSTVIAGNISSPWGPNLWAGQWPT
jgi:hypothetical protein